jgi:hypothetical protein
MVTNRRIPFKITYLDHGYAEVRGLLHIKNDGILLEFEHDNHGMRYIAAGLDDVNLPYEEVESIIYRKKWIGAEIHIQSTSIRTLENVPGSEQGRCTLKIKRKDRKEAERAVSKARVELSEHKLKQLED